MSSQEPDFAAIGVAAVVLGLLGTETDEEKRLKAVAANALQVFGLKREPSVSLGALIARDIRIAQAEVDGAEWHVAVLTGESAQELDAVGVAKIDRAYQETISGTWKLASGFPWRGRYALAPARGKQLMLGADERVPMVVLGKLAVALSKEIASGDEPPQT